MFANFKEDSKLLQKKPLSWTAQTSKSKKKKNLRHLSLSLDSQISEHVSNNT